MVTLVSHAGAPLRSRYGDTYKKKLTPHVIAGRLTKQRWYYQGRDKRKFSAPIRYPNLGIELRHVRNPHNLVCHEIMHHVPNLGHERHGGVWHHFLQRTACSLSTILSSRPAMIAVAHLRRRYDIVSVAADGSMKATFREENLRAQAGAGRSAFRGRADMAIAVRNVRL